MSAGHQHDPQVNDQSGRWFAYKNGSGETIPPFACIRLGGWVAGPFGAMISGLKPNGSQAVYGINDHQSVPANGYGQLTLAGPMIAAYDDSDGTPTISASMGPKTGEWRLFKDQTGFLSTEDGADGIIWVMPVASGTPLSLKMVKLESGESLSYLTPGTPASVREYVGTPGSETVTGSPFDIYGGGQLHSPVVISDTDGYKLIVGEVNGEWQLLGPWRNAGSGSGGITIVAELGSDLAKTDATKAATVIAGYGTGAPSSGSVTMINPEAKGGNYMFRATASTQYVLGVSTENAGEYLIIGTQPVAFDPVDDVAWTSPDLEQTKRDIDIGYSGSTATTTILTGDPTCPTP